jgi:hypothetical protein
MKALSIKQPWAWLICAGYKDIENRNWKIGRNPNHGPYQSQRADFGLELPQRIYVHAGKMPDVTPGVQDFLYRVFDADVPHQVHDLAPLLLGAIIGEVTITGCVTESPSPWFVGKYGFTLTNPTLYDTPIPCRGALGFFTPDIRGAGVSGGGQLGFGPARYFARKGNWVWQG